MELWELLGIRPGLTAVIGSGGKTSLLRVLAQELSHRGTVLVSTTTRIMRPELVSLRRHRSGAVGGLCPQPHRLRRVL